jgi:hypothetical protein
MQHARAMSLTTPVNHVFLDFENVHEIDLAAIGSKAVSFTLLLGPHQTKLDVAIVEKLMEHANSVKLVRLNSAGRNALDFTLAYYIGRAVSSDPTGFFYIIAKDTGYDPLVEHLKKNHIHASRHDDFAGLPFLAAVQRSVVAKPKAGPKAKAPHAVLDELFVRVVEHLRKNSSNRPRTKTRLVSNLLARFPKEISELDIGGIIDRLCKVGHISIDAKGATTYQLEKK